MAKPVILRSNNQEYSFDSIKVDRAKLYGVRKRLPVDLKGHPCVKASLASDGANLQASEVIFLGSSQPSNICAKPVELLTQSK